MILATHGIVGSQITQFVGLLDTYSGAAAAYSLRKLRSAYTGSAIRVRRTDLSEANIGFTSNGELDTTALLAFTGTGALDNGFIKTWYDQSGNGNDATQTTAANQPQIVSSGSVILENGKPSVQFDGSDDYLYSSTFSQSQPNTIFCVIKQTRTNIGGESFLQSSSNSTLLYSFSTTNYAIFAGSSLQGDTTNTNQNLHYALVNGLSSKLQTNNSTEYSGGVNIGVWTDLYLSSRGGTQQFSNAKYQEIIIFSGNKSTDKSGIQTNINNFYSIY